MSHSEINKAPKNILFSRLKKQGASYIPWLILFFSILGITFILIYQRGWGQLSVKKGDTIEELIRAPKTVTFKSEVKTEELKAKVAAEVPKVYRLDSRVVSDQENKINSLFNKINEIRNSSRPLAEKEEEFKGIKEINFTADQIKQILNLSNADWDQVCQNTKTILLDLQKNEKIKYEELNNFKNKIPLRVNPGFSESKKSLIIFLSQSLLLPNTFLDEVETNKRINEAREEVSPVYYTIEKDQIILRPGDKVTDFDLEKLEALGLTSPWGKSYKFFSLLIIITILSLLSFIFIQYFLQTSLSSWRVLLIYFTFLLVSLGAARFVLPLKPIIAYLFPLAAPVMILAVLIDFHLGILSALMFSLFFSLVIGGSFELLIIQFITSLTGVLLAVKIKKISGFIKLIFLLALANFLASLAFNFWVGNFSLRTALVLLTAGLICGVTNTVLLLGALFFSGNILGVTSFLQLFDLANPDQPLLKKLSVMAPGTYHHSILVSNLAEAGAKAIGADPLLARVASYYHDIGKMENPLFFIENQEGKINIHEGMDPQRGAALIIDHVKRGLKIAEENRLPQEIKQIIAEHHGTTKVQFFYQLARKQKIRIKVGDFVYPGPRPSTKESAIIMLADSVEAATRSLSHFTPKSVEKKIAEIIRQRFEEGQLDNSPLTARDLNRLKTSFIETTNAVFHQRLDYPSKKERGLKFPLLSSNKELAIKK